MKNTTTKEQLIQLVKTALMAPGQWGLHCVIEDYESLDYSTIEHYSSEEYVTEEGKHLCNELLKWEEIERIEIVELGMIENWKALGLITAAEVEERLSLLAQSLKEWPWED